MSLTGRAIRFSPEMGYAPLNMASPFRGRGYRSWGVEGGRPLAGRVPRQRGRVAGPALTGEMTTATLATSRSGVPQVLTATGPDPDLVGIHPRPRRYRHILTGGRGRTGSWPTAGTRWTG